MSRSPGRALAIVAAAGVLAVLCSATVERAAAASPRQIRPQQQFRTPISHFTAALAIARGNPTAYDTLAINQGFAPLGTAAKGTSLRKFLQIRTIKPGGSCK